MVTSSQPEGPIRTHSVEDGFIEDHKRGLMKVYRK